ncbi:histone-lysine N-methyltransferase, H3 lysine-79 specific-like [Asterias rubens]|uniref:histone-lysine N-methyltransferase, H3 lysine-79 specific-like n=1 Tax=Asterias rubens TaxID=7604 RepID=UPI001455D5C6|nr:histone-lysine N-methyltransferase, H3 lysine-79 specific-like [Asterias rubens]
MEQVAEHVAQELLEMNSQARLASTAAYLKESEAQVEILQLQAQTDQLQKSTILSTQDSIHDSLATQLLNNMARLQHEPKQLIPDQPSQQQISRSPSTTVHQTLGFHGNNSNVTFHDNRNSNFNNAHNGDIMNPDLIETNKNQQEANGQNDDVFVEDPLPTLFYVTTLEEANEAVHKFEKETGTKYTCYKNTAGFGNTEYKVEKPHKIYFEERSVDLCGFGIPYDGIPFVNIGKKVMDCEYGIDRCVAAKRKYMERHLSDVTIIRRPLAQERTKKIKCKAQIRMKEIFKYPEFKISIDTSSRKKKVNLSIALREALKSGSVKGEKRIYIQLPRISDHKNHPLGEDAVKEVKTSLSGKQALKEVNALSWDLFIQQFGNVVEHGQVVASAAWAKRPFVNMKALHRAFCEYLDSMTHAGKEALIRCYPNLESTSPRVLSSDTSCEFHKLGLHLLSAEESSLLTQLNSKYRHNFHFPFIVCMQELNKEMFFTELQKRTQNSRETEALNAMKEIKKIAWHRILNRLRIKTFAASQKLCEVKQNT